jgi:tryptophan 2,3-dioxygenase
MSTAELYSWLQNPDPKKFPYDAVVNEYHAVGKNFVSAELIEVLTRVRSVLPSTNAPWQYTQTLAAFLATALDKPDGRYDYPTYLALSLIDIPSIDDPVEQAAFARSRCDRLISHLMADTLRFELTATSGASNLLPKMRPEQALVTKRYRLGVRAIMPAMERICLDSGITATEPDDLARQVSALLHADMSTSERRSLSLSILPVATLHDEYMFLRVLQMFETTFALLVAQLRGALKAVAERDVDLATHFLDLSTGALTESAPLFSMLATMQVESFRTFRDFTEGASAIQSRNYKRLEAICRRPDPERLDSPAYRSVPEVHTSVLAGEPSLDDAYTEACGDLEPADLKRLEESMQAFSQGLLRWRQTHYRLATRMLGTASGTGYTEGTPYLDAARTIPVFTTVDGLDAEPVDPGTTHKPETTHEPEAVRS